MKNSSSKSNFERTTATDAEQARTAGQSVSEPSLTGGVGLAPISPWQRERALRLHRICQFIQARVAKGQSLNKACRLFSKRWNGKHLRSNPTRCYALNVSSLHRHFHRWKLGGEVPSALQLQYRPINRRVPATVLVRFVELCAARDFTSFRAAWQTFCRRGRNAGPGTVNGRKLKLGYHSLRWNLPRGSFAALKEQWKILRQAERRIQMLRLKYTAEIRAHVPDRLPCPRVKREVDFQI